MCGYGKIISFRMIGVTTLHHITSCNREDMDVSAAVYSVTRHPVFLPLKRVRVGEFESHELSQVAPRLLPLL